MIFAGNIAAHMYAERRAKSVILWLQTGTTGPISFSASLFVAAIAAFRCIPVASPQRALPLAQSPPLYVLRLVRFRIIVAISYMPNCRSNTLNLFPTVNGQRMERNVCDAPISSRAGRCVDVAVDSGFPSLPHCCFLKTKTVHWA